MFETKIDYIDGRDNKRVKTLYFHLDKFQMRKMVMAETTIYEGMEQDPTSREVYNGIQDRIRGVSRRGDGAEMLAMWDWIVDHAYGELSDDGDDFDQSPEALAKWKRNFSYRAVMDRLAEDDKYAQLFLNSIFPSDLVAKAKEDPEFARHREELEKRGLA